MDFGQWIIIGLCVVMVIWYLIGSYVNKQRGIETFNWLRKGIETTGKVSQTHWIGSSGSGAQMLVEKANKPFSQIEVVFLLDSREILPIWLLNLIRGKQDEMILKANLHFVISQEFEVGVVRSREIQSLLSSNLQPPFVPVETPGGLKIICRGENSGELLSRLQAFVNKYADAIQQLSLRREKPHLILRLNLPPLREKSAGDFFTELKTWLQK